MNPENEGPALAGSGFKLTIVYPVLNRHQPCAGCAIPVKPQELRRGLCPKCHAWDRAAPHVSIAALLMKEAAES